MKIKCELQTEIKNILISHAKKNSSIEIVLDELKQVYINANSFALFNRDNSLAHYRVIRYRLRKKLIDPDTGKIIK